jgi:hypothetical protein
MPSNSGPQRAASNPAERDNSSLSLRNSVRMSFDFAQDHELVEWRRCEVASQLVFVRSALARTPGILSVYGIVSHFGAIYLCCITQVWARGMVKKDIPMLMHLTKDTSMALRKGQE